MDLSQYYLDLEKVNSLDKEMANKIHEYYRDMIISLNGYLLATPALFFETLDPPPREDFQMTVIPNQQPSVFTNNAGIYYKIHSLPTGGAKTSKNARHIGSRT
jgi:hypothetical protein